MKKILFLLIPAALLLAGFTPAKQHFKIRGTINVTKTEKMYEQGRVLLIVPGSKPDTLARAFFSDTTFVLEGDVDRLTAAVIKFAGTYVLPNQKKITLYTKRDVTLFLEEGEYEAHMGGHASVRGGGKEQQTASIFENHYQAYAVRSDELRALASKLPKEDSLSHALLQVDQEQNQQALRAKLRRFIALCNGSYAAAYYAEKLSDSRPLDEQREIYNLLDEQEQASKHGQRLIARVQEQEAIERGKLSIVPGKIAPDFTMEMPDGKIVSMHSIRCKVKLIDFWASWCGPCRKENPAVKKLYEEYHSRGLEIVGVSCDTDREKWLKAIQEDALPWTHGWKTEALKLYFISTIPFTVLVDKKNRIIATNLRGEALRAKIAELLD
jgi:thiol-disulfide isomerase/thioredoxin